MASEKAGVSDKAVAGVASGRDQAEVAEAPFLKVAAECWGPEGLKWRDGFEHNVVVIEGLRHMGNVFIGGARATTDGPFLFVHSANATTSDASTRGWQQLAGSVSNIQSCCSASYFPADFATNAFATTQSVTTQQSFIFTSATSASANGAGFFFYTSASCATNAATGDLKLYNYGAFGTPRSVTQNDTLVVSATLALQTA